MQRGWLRFRSMAPRLALGAAVMLGLAACTDEAGTPPDPAAANALKNTEFAFDNYRGLEMEIIDYSRQVLYGLCMEKAGYPQIRQADATRPYPTTSLFTTLPSQFGLVSEEQARAKGFGQDPGWAPPKIVGTDANLGKADEQCNTVGWQQLGPESEQLILDYQALGNELLPYWKEVDARTIPALAPKMLECVKAKGYQPADEQQFLKTPRFDMLGVPLGSIVGASNWEPDPAAHTVQVDPTNTRGHYVPTPEESRLAVAWYHCQESTGLARTRLAMAATVQRELIEKHAGELYEMNPKIEALAKKAVQLAGTK